MRKLFGPKAALVCAAGALAVVVTAVTPDGAAAQRTSRSAGAQKQQQARPAGPQLDRARGSKEAPAAIQAAGITCTPTDAAFVGALQSGSSVYEVACREGLGYMVTGASATGPARSVDCLNQNAQAAAQPAIQPCRLPGNAQPARGLQPTVMAAGLTCTVNNARYLGEITGGASSRYEIGCAEGGGYVLDRPRAAATKPTAVNCLRASAGGQFQCQFTTQAQALAPITAAVNTSRRQCTVTQARLVGTNPRTSNEIYEVGCAPGQAGFFLETAANGAFVEARDCGRFSEACQFTAAETVVARNAADYSRLLREARFDCAVTNFNRLGAETGTNREIVEVACSNRPDGAFALLATGPGQQSEIYDCLLASKRNQRCQLTQPDALYPKVSAAITAAQKSACTVTNHRRMGTTTQGEDWYEFACSQGRNAVVDYRGDGRVRQVVRCANATEILRGCQLPVAAASGRR